jgi:hypothetical protein
MYNGQAHLEPLPLRLFSVPLLRLRHLHLLAIRLHCITLQAVQPGSTKRQCRYQKDGTSQLYQWSPPNARSGIACEPPQARTWSQSSTMFCSSSSSISASCRGQGQWGKEVRRTADVTSGRDCLIQGREHASRTTDIRCLSVSPTHAPAPPRPPPCAVCRIPQPCTPAQPVHVQGEASQSIVRGSGGKCSQGLVETGCSQLAPSIQAARHPSSQPGSPFPALHITDRPPTCAASWSLSSRGASTSTNRTA